MGGGATCPLPVLATDAEPTGMQQASINMIAEAR